MSIISLLKRVHLFDGLDETELAALADICTEHLINPNELILEQNTTGTELYIIADGSVEVFVKGLKNARSLVVLGKGQVVGEMALIDQGYRSASVQATKSGATLYCVQSKNFYQLCQENTRIGYQVMRNLAIDVAFKLRHRNLADI